ncbi:hypothetical protein KIW84_010829 [Lathyrus oleraceus]|uniref:Uncharacterized protein n=1 Tax=Pisum sativum TaxID=3888 RepID=A0A9D4YN41_PEA|nr:hypothetical protein KIW84_010829 [Pisum sativum]
MTTSLLSPHERIPSISVLAGIDRVILVQFNIGPIDIYPVMQDGQIPSRSLMSLSMLRGVPINCLYGYPVTDNVGSTIKHSTPHLGSIVVSGRRVMALITSEFAEDICSESELLDFTSCSDASDTCSFVQSLELLE